MNTTEMAIHNLRETTQAHRGTPRLTFLTGTTRSRIKTADTLFRESFGKKELDLESIGAFVFDSYFTSNYFNSLSLMTR